MDSGKPWADRLHAPRTDSVHAQLANLDFGKLVTDISSQHAYQQHAVSRQIGQIVASKLLVLVCPSFKGTAWNTENRGADLLERALSTVPYYMDDIKERGGKETRKKVKDIMDAIHTETETALKATNQTPEGQYHFRNLL
jgi:hypothetical protein